MKEVAEWVGWAVMVGNIALAIANLAMSVSIGRQRKRWEALLAQAEAKLAAGQELARAVKAAGVNVPGYLRDMAKEIFPSA